MNAYLYPIKVTNDFFKVKTRGFGLTILFSDIAALANHSPLR
jgi:hypothetical protein